MMKKQRLKQLIYGSELRCLAIITNGIVHHVPKQMVLRNIKLELTKTASTLKLSNVSSNSLYLKNYELYNKISKMTFAKLQSIDRKFGRKEDYEENLRQRQNTLYQTVQNLDVISRIEQEKNIVADRKEFEIKHEYIWGETGIIETNRSKKETYSPFFLCSSHEKPAKDHEDWEGKMYYDEDWHGYIDDVDQTKRIESYIRNHKLKSVQWVCGEPVYLVTRKNCKHYLTNIPVDEVLSSSAKKLLRQYELYMAEDKPLSYEQSQKIAYYERLKALTYLNKISPSEELTNDIKRVRLLYQKWKDAGRA